MARLAAVATALGLSMAILWSASADDPGPGDPGAPGDNKPGTSLSVESNDDGVTIYISFEESSPGGSTDPSTGGGGPGSGGWSCTSHPMSIGNAMLEWFEQEAPLHPGEAPWIVWCNDEFIGIVWLPITVEPPDIQIIVVPAVSIDPVSIAAELRDGVLVPDITVGVNPDVGLVAMPAWFWIEGYDGSQITTSETLGGTTVEVEITPTNYAWSFGDGATMNTLSLGRPYPQASDIRHTYEQSSLSAGGAFSVTVEISFSVRYRVDGGAWQPLDPISRSFTAAYPVQQLQSVLTGS
jgi:hypothetical protein